jgi:dolichol-phosphate mannosyltransferase
MGKCLSEGAAIVIQMDADLSHPPSAIPRMIDTVLTTDASVVIGSRYVAGGAVAENWPWHRKALSAWANFYVNTILRLRTTDATAGFKVWHASTLQAIDVTTVMSNGYAFQVEMNYRVVRQGMRIAEVPIRFCERAEGESKMSLAVQIESALVPWKLRFGRFQPGRGRTA